MINFLFYQTLFSKECVYAFGANMKIETIHQCHKKQFFYFGQPLNANEQGGDNNVLKKFPQLFRCPFFSCTLPVSCLFCHKTDRHFLERMGCKKNHPAASVTMDVSGISDWFKILP